MANLEELLHQRLAPAFEAVAGSPVDPVIRRSQHAHFQSDAALALVRKIGGNPREIAARVVEAAQLDDLCSSVEISGPGFINLTFADEVLGRLLADTVGDERLAVPQAKDPETITVDYSAPNAAKEMHVGHLRSTIIGDAAVRLLEWQGHTIIRQNHIGEWGTPFGMLVEHLLDIGESEAAHELSVGDSTASTRLLGASSTRTRRSRTGLASASCCSRAATSRPCVFGARSSTSPRTTS